jgi:prophage maintenance system killer protein
MAVVFGVNSQAVTKHLKNIYREGELNKDSTCSKMEQVQKEGGRVVKRQVEAYNLDAMISVGYRISSKAGTRFRQWATRTLRAHIINGYTLNEKRLRSQTQKIKDLQETVRLLGNIVSLEDVSIELKGIIRIVAEYSRALDILDDYDHQRLSVPKGSRRLYYDLTYEEAKRLILAMKEKFAGSDLVGQERDSSFKSSLGSINQTFGGKDVYPTVEEKAAHLLYFVTKNHSFVDGNKRIAAALFVCFLQGNRILLRKDGSKRIDDGALAALTLMIAASKPAEKDTMIKVLLNLLK